MPKIIENVREQLLAEAKKQISERGYSRTTIRSVAGECGLAVGTMYNYFSSKDMLIASFMLEDWKSCLAQYNISAERDPEKLLRGIYSALQSFIVIYRALFSDPDAARVFASAFSERHKLLRDQLADIILPVCSGDNPSFTAQFISESLLTWTVAGASFEEIFLLLKKII